MAGESLTAPVGLREAGQVHQAAQPHSPGGARLVLVPWSPPPPPPPSLWKDSRLTGGILSPGHTRATWSPVKTQAPRAWRWVDSLHS